jgi:hypothetical protein
MRHFGVKKTEDVLVAHFFWPEMRRDIVTPTFYKNRKICANRSAYKNAYQIVVHMKNFPKINLV